MEELTPSGRLKLIAGRELTTIRGHRLLLLLQLLLLLLLLPPSGDTDYYYYYNYYYYYYYHHQGTPIAGLVEGALIADNTPM